MLQDITSIHKLMNHATLPKIFRKIISQITLSNNSLKKKKKRPTPIKCYIIKFCKPKACTYGFFPKLIPQN